MFDQPDNDPREFGPQHSMCRECGECTCDDCDGHAVSCTFHVDFFEPDFPDDWDDEDF